MFAKRVVTVAAAIASIAALGTVTAPGASAAGQDGVAESEEFIFFYNSNYGGSYSDFASNKPDLAGYTFLRQGLNGYGQAVKNNSASVYNNRTQAARVYFNSGYAGAVDQVPGMSGRNLTLTYNENASFRWI